MLLSGAIGESGTGAFAFSPNVPADASVVYTYSFVSTNSLQYANLGQSFLAKRYTAGDSTITVKDGYNFPVSGDYWLAFDDPPSFYLKCSGRSGVVLSVSTSATDGTTAGNRIVNTKVTEVLTASAIDQLKTDLSALITAAIPLQLIASSYVETSEGTTSLSLVDLATPDTVSFTLAGSTLVAIRYIAFGTNNASSNTQFNQGYIDGVAVGNEQGNYKYNQFGEFSIWEYKGTIAAGSHTVTVKHRVDSGSSGYNWAARLLEVGRVS